MGIGRISFYHFLGSLRHSVFRLHGCVERLGRCKESNKSVDTDEEVCVDRSINTPKVHLP